MSSLILPRRFTSQPQGAVEVDWNNQLVLHGDLVSATLPGAGSITTQAGRAGLLLVDLSVPDSDRTRKGVLVSSLVRGAAASAAWANYYGMRRMAVWTSDVEQALLSSGAAGTDSAATLRHNTSDAFAYAMPLPAAYSTAQYAMEFDATASTGYFAGVYKNAVWQGNFGTSGVFPWDSGVTRGYLAGSAGLGVYAEYGYLFGDKKSISTADLLTELARNPWQLFRAPKRVLYFDAGGAGGPAADLAGTATDQSTATGSLTTAIPIAGAAAVVSTAAGALSTAIPLGGQSASVGVAGGVLTAQITLTGAALAQALASGALAASAAQLAGAAVDSATAAGSLTTQISLSGAALAQALAAAGLTTTPSGLAGSATAQASAGGALLTQIPLAGTASAWASATGGVSTLIAMSGAAATVSSATGALTIQGTLSGNALAQAIAAGSLTTIIRLDAAALAQAAASGALSGTPTHTARVRTLHTQARRWHIAAVKRKWSIAA